MLAGEAAVSADALAAMAAEDRERLTRFAQWFAAERARAARSGLEELIDAALRRTGYDLAMLALPGGRRRLANVRKLMRLAREYEAEHGADLRGFVEFVGERAAGRVRRLARERGAGRGRGARRGPPDDHPPGQGARVRDRLRGRPRPLDAAARRRSCAWPPTAGSASAWPGPGWAVASRRSPTKQLGEQQRAAEESEERRLFYVAMTRARERLVLSGAAKFEGWLEGDSTGGGPIAWIAPAFFPDLGTLIADGGGVIERDGVRLALRLIGPRGRRRGTGRDGHRGGGRRY